MAEKKLGRGLVVSLVSPGSAPVSRERSHAALSGPGQAGLGKLLESGWEGSSQAIK